ncbi:type VI secretion system tip protein TssI/VgrG [Alkalimonas collagenimarina]|uniref:Type VI secretion system tip protein TssI/VgrG n=1 Tax=Alkalimonas collagenimarina TaxID=400390 RepID=A0ABT9H2X4_9GAMM|nr:type VI secretion system tip protein TssI/VgrG [Alkalimonas collagenimarina]MDP4537660.1 type VI secretion system tip protein TssI/VgrG [Alkalimonas collagenimarina]
MQKATQEENSIEIITPLGKDVLYLTRFSFKEGISKQFVVSSDVYTNGQTISANDLIGKEVTIRLELGSEQQRYIHGKVADMQALGLRVNKDATDNDYRDYRLTIVPASWFMQHRVNSRIFREKNVLRIIEELAGEHDIDIDTTTYTGGYPDYDFKVQYQESDLNFLLRLMEEEGLFYFFEHTDSSHTLVLADKASAYKPCQKNASVKFHTGSLAEDHILSWQNQLSMVPGQFVQRHYDVQKPKSLPTGQYQNGNLVPQHANYEVFDYGAEAESLDRAQDIASIRLESMQKDMDVRAGTSNCRDFAAAKTFTITEHEDDKEVGKQYVITEVELIAAVSNQSGASMDGQCSIYNSFKCVQKKVVYRPYGTAYKPLISGVQTATVTCKGDEEISVDELGRVTVKFHWDRSDIKDHESSCAIRVSQHWAGKNWGAFFFPRRDQEVLVEFINGDPDQPIITGAVYNSDHMPPYNLPDDKTQSGIKSRSTKKGGADNFNELRFEDKKGEELFYLHAEKDLTMQVENDYTMHVENDQKDLIDNDRSTVVKANDSLDVKKERVSSIGQSDKLDVGKKLVINAGDSITLKTGAASISLKSDGSIDIKGVNITIKGAKVSLN